MTIRSVLGTNDTYLKKTIRDGTDFPAKAGILAQID